MEGRPAVYTIKKVLNSSVVLVTDGAGREFILLGKGIGYGKKAGTEIPRSDENQVFVPVEEGRSGQVRELMSSVAPEIVEVTQEIVAESKRLLGCELSPSIYFMLADHLGFAIERARRGMAITNRVFWEIKNYYPDEFRAGLLGLGLVESRLGISLPEEEAANIAFHIANARAEDGSLYDAARYAKVIGKIINVVVFSLNRPVDTKSIHYLRFVTHVKYFVERYFSDVQLSGEDDLLFLQLSAKYEREMSIAYKIKEYMEREYGKIVTRDEVVYLVVHILRLSSA